jgi:hypothetical protein
MRRLKFALTIALAIILIYSCTSFSFADSAENNLSFEEKSALSCSISDQIQSDVESDISLKNKFGGIYIDKDGNLNVLYVGDYVGLEVESEKIIFHQAVYTKEHLLNVYSRLSEKMEDLSLCSVSIDEINNKVIVCIDDTSDLNIVNEIQEFENSESIEIQEFDHIGQTIETTNILGGRGANNNSQLLTTGLGVASIYSPYPTYFTIPGHATGAVGSNVYYESNGAQIGDIYSKRYAGSVDASLCTGYGSYTPSKYLSDNTQCVGYATSFTVGQSLKSYSYVSGIQYGTILVTSYSEYFGGFTHTDLLKCDYVAIGGDSGSPITSPYVSGTKVLQGLQSASHLVLGSWVPGTSYSLVSKFKNIAEYFHVSLMVG